MKKYTPRCAAVPTFKGHHRHRKKQWNFSEEKRKMALIHIKWEVKAQQGMLCDSFSWTTEVS